MNTQSPSFYQRVIDKTKGLAFQSQFIAQNVDKRKAVVMSMANPGAVVRPSSIYCNYNTRSLLLQAAKPQVKRWAPAAT